MPEGVRVEVFWRDVTAEPLERQYNLMVMNPPFHAVGHGADPALGLAMIEAAAKGLRKGGRLYMVANVALPYERFLTGAVLRDSRNVRATQGFKVLVATRLISSQLSVDARGMEASSIGRSACAV